MESEYTDRIGKMDEQTLQMEYSNLRRVIDMKISFIPSGQALERLQIVVHEMIERIIKSPNS